MRIGDLSRLGSAAQLQLAAIGLRPKRRSKYNADHVVVDGIRFDSKLEARRYHELNLWQRGGEIEGLQVHPVFDLGAGIKYIADFLYYETQSGDLIVEDCKSGPTRTAVYRMKRRMMKDLLGITITEIMRDK